MCWVEIGREADFPTNSASEMVVGDRIVAVCNADGQIHALDGVCPHQGGPLGKGEIEGCILTCPWHGWQFDVRDGQSLLSPHVKHTTLQVRTEDGRVWIQVNPTDEE